MKIAITATGNDLGAPLDPRFGRALKFLLYDTEREDLTIIDNAQNFNAAQGAGVQAAESVVRAGAQQLITGHCGPKAFRVLSAAGVTIYNTEASTVGEALSLYKAGELAEATNADVEGHWI